MARNQCQSSWCRNEISRLQQETKNLKEEKEKDRREFEQRLTEKDVAIAKANEAAMTDVLTSLPNRRHFEEVFIREVAQARRGQHRLFVAYIDVDKFGEFNRMYGHAVGDMVLKLIAETLRSSLRAGDFCARQGGDEFVALLQAVSDADEEGLEKRLAEVWGKGITLTVGSEELVVTATVGLAKMNVSDSTESFIAQADRALLSAKESSMRLRVVK